MAQLAVTGVYTGEGSLLARVYVNPNKGGEC